MQLKSIVLRGYLGIPPEKDRAITLSPIARRGGITLLIGPNNSGKSTIIRFLVMLQVWLKQQTWSADPRQADPSLDQLDFWNHDDNASIFADVVISDVESTLSLPTPLLLTSTGELHIQVQATKTKFQIIPLIHRNEEPPIPLWTESGNQPVFEPIGGMSNDVFQNTCNEWMKEFFSLLAKSLVLFDTNRGLDRRGQGKMEDGSSLLKHLWVLKSDTNRPGDWSKFRSKFMSQVNEILRPSGMPVLNDIEIKLNKPNDSDSARMFVTFDSGKELPVEIDQLGMGFSQLLIILSLLTRRKLEPTIVCVEEPETNLHPGLLRRFVDQLRKYDHVQFIFTSHSHVLLDCLTPVDQVFRFHQQSDGRCSADLCASVGLQHSLLDALGVRASSLLQTNCVIWVEGPSDRHYVRRWINELAPALIEERDFTFNYYGGTLLAHLDMVAKDELSKDVIAMLSISRFGVVIMDRDLSPNEPDDKLAPRKRRVIDSAKSDPTHRLAIVTNGRDIENDIPPSLLLEASAGLLGCTIDKLSSAKLTSERGFEDEIIDALHLDVKEAKTKKRALGRNKPELARIVVELCESRTEKLQPPDYMKKVVALIQRSECIEGAVSN